MPNFGKQFFRFSIVGLLAFLIDYGLLFLLTEAAHMHYLLSASISFTAATIFNYIYSMKYVFAGREDMARVRRFMIFILLSLCGLFWNSYLMNQAVERFQLHYMAAKAIAALLVMVWNFVTRKVFLEEREWKKETMQV